MATHIPETAPDTGTPPRPPLPPARTLLYPGDEEPLLNFPGLDAAVKLLQDRKVLTADDFYKLSATAKQDAFTISGDITAHSIDRVRQILAEQLESGPSYQQFARAVHEAIDKLPIGESHLEQVYRNAVNESFSQGMESILEHPIVADGFPYRGYYAIHDARARHDHLALDHLGLNGTNVYYRLDPTWIRFRPPWDFGCRCGWISLSIKSAAQMGVREAQEWLRTGIEPDHEFVTPPPFSPSPSWDRMGATV